MPDEAADSRRTGKKKSRLTTTLALVAGIAIIEGAGFFVATRFFGGGPQVAHGAEGREGDLLDGGEAGDVPETVEIELLRKFQVPNDQKGRLYVYDFDVAVKVPGHRKEEIETLAKDRLREISDRIARIVRAADPAVLHEPELKTLRLQLQHAVGEVAGDQDAIIEVLIPRCVPIRSD